MIDNLNSFIWGYVLHNYSIKYKFYRNANFHNNFPYFHLLKQLFSKENARSKREFLITHAKESTNNKEFQRKLASYFIIEVTTKMVW